MIADSISSRMFFFAMDGQHGLVVIGVVTCVQLPTSQTKSLRGGRHIRTTGEANNNVMAHKHYQLHL